jgi:hypothetical protein
MQVVAVSEYLDGSLIVSLMKRKVKEQIRRSFALDEESLLL